MIPSLAGLDVQRYDGTRHNFKDNKGTVVFYLEQRTAVSIALVGVPRGGNIQISAPEHDHDGLARIVYGETVGICDSGAGISATRQLLAAAHNRGHSVLTKKGYLIANFSTNDSISHVDT